jgi:hypothetical protein
MFMVSPSWCLPLVGKELGQHVVEGYKLVLTHVLAAGGAPYLVKLHAGILQEVVKVVFVHGYTPYL